MVIRTNCWKGGCTSSSFARSISRLCCLFSTSRLHSALDTFSYKICFLIRVKNLQAMKILTYMILAQRGSSLYKPKLERQLLRENGETARDAVNHFKNFADLWFSIWWWFYRPSHVCSQILTVRLELQKNSGKNTRKSADAVAESASSKGFRMLSFVHDLQVFASPNSEDDVI